MANTIHLYMVGSTYYFRCRIPKDLQCWFNGIRDHKRTLRTKNLSKAQSLFRIHSSRTEMTLMMLRSGLLDDAQMSEVVEEYINHGQTSRKKNIQPNNVPTDSVNYVSLQPIQELTSIPSAAVSKDSLLSFIVEKYIQEYKDTENVGSTSVYELETKCRLFVRIVGDMDIKAVTRDTVLGFLKVLRLMPKNMSKQKMYSGKSIDDVIKMKPTDTLSDTTVSNYLIRITSFFAWAYRVGHIDRNPADRIKFSKKKMLRPDELRKAYSQHDLKKLVDSYSNLSDDEQGKLKSSPDRFWIPFIALYSGMRLNEICQLHIEDVQEDSETGIWYFNIEVSDDDSKTIKTAAARRMIPIHEHLIKIGFIDYYKSIVSSKKPRLWMGLTKSVRGYHRNFVYWFLGHTTTKGFLRKYVTTDDKLNFHSFRHTFINALKQKMVDKLVLAEIAGHSSNSETFGRYGKPYELEAKMTVLKQLEYPLDLEKLKVMASLTM